MSNADSVCSKKCTAGILPIRYLYVQPKQAMANPSLVHYSGHNKLSALLAGPDFSLMGKAADFLAGLIELTVPEGYEDEAGFHYLPARSGRSRPPMDGPVWLGEYI